MKKTNIRILFSILLLSVSISSCVSTQVNTNSKYSDQEYFDKIAGGWKSSYSFASRATVYNHDGSFEGVGQFRIPENYKNISLKGTWQIDKGMLVSKVTQSSNVEIIQVDTETKSHIISIDDRKLVLLSETGGEVILTKLVLAFERENHQHLVEEYLRVTHLEQLLDKLVQDAKYTISKKINEIDEPFFNNDERRAKFHSLIMELFDKHMSWENTKFFYIDIFSDVYSGEELKALIDFYNSPLGQKIAERSPELNTRSFQFTQEQLTNFATDLQKNIEKFKRESAYMDNDV